MKTTKPITLTATDFEHDKKYEVTYHLDSFKQTGTAFIWVEYEGEEFLRLTVNYEDLPNKNWAYFYFHTPMYWLVLPLLNEGIVRMNCQTHCHTISTQLNFKNVILGEVDEKYFL